MSQVTVSPWSEFAKWGGAFAVYAIVITMLADSDEYGEVGVAMAWVVAAGAFFALYNDFDTSLAQLIGQSPSTTGNTG